MAKADNRSRHHRRGVGLLALSTLLWGSTFILTKQAIPTISVSRLLFARFVVAAALFLPFLRAGRQLWRGGLELGLLAGLGYALQSAGLQYTTVGRSAFIGALNVIFVAMLGAVLGRVPTRRVWAAVALAIVGTGLLSDDGGPPNRGDLLTLCCAVLWAAYIVRLEHWTARLPSRPLTAIQLLVIAAIAGSWAIFQPSPRVLPAGASATPLVLLVLYLGVAATALTTWLQTIGQKSVPAAEAAVLYTLEPVWATAFAFLLAGQLPGLRGCVGGMLIIVAAVVSQLPAAASKRSARQL